MINKGNPNKLSEKFVLVPRKAKCDFTFNFNLQDHLGFSSDYTHCCLNHLCLPYIYDLEYRIISVKDSRKTTVFIR
jgi:hypothetical protein